MNKSYIINLAFALFTTIALSQSNTDCSLLKPIITTTEVEMCHPGGKVELNAKTNYGDFIYWYDTKDANNPIIKGENFSSEVITDSTSLWVSEIIYEDKKTSNHAKPSYSGDFAIGFNWAAGLIFRADKHFIINSAEVYPTSPLEGVVASILLIDESDNIIGEVKDIFIPEVKVIGSPKPIVVELNFKVPKPGIYKLITTTVENEANPALAVDLPGTKDLVYPYSISNVAEVTSGFQNDQVQNEMYFYFYNWSITVEDVICESIREEIKINVNQDYPETPEISSPYILCGDLDFTLEDIIVDANNPQWFDSEWNQLQIDFLIEEDTTYYLADKSSGGCLSEYAEVNFTILPISDQPIAEPEQSFEFNSGATLASLNVDGENLTWYADSELKEQLSDSTLLEDGVAYFVTQTIDNHCESYPITIIASEILSVEDIVFEDLKYTNPVNHIMYLSNSEVIDEVILYDLSGKKHNLYKVNSTQKEINLSNLSQGLYLIELNVKGKSKIIKIIKN